jgi:hypothetical protein
VALSLTALVTLLYSAPLWQAHDLPPQVPPFGLAPPGWLDLPLFVLALAVLLLLLRGGRLAAAAALTFVGAILLLVAGDQHRWQPEVQMFVVFALGLGACSHVPRSREPVLALLRVYLVSVYAYSGVQKLNPGFVDGIAPWLVQPATGWIGLPPDVGNHELWPAVAIAIALTEASVAVLLTLPRTRDGGVALAAAMHAFLLLTLGPLGHNYNAVIWPWNVFMAVAVGALFWRQRAAFVSLGAHPLAIATAALIALYPAGHAVGLIDPYPAHNLYTAFTGGSSVCLPPGVPITDATWRRHIDVNARDVDGQQWQCVDGFGWYMDALRVPPYNAPRLQAAVAVAACDAFGPEDIELREWGRPPLLRVAAPFPTSRAYRGCDAVRAHAESNLLGASPR